MMPGVQHATRMGIILKSSLRNHDISAKGSHKTTQFSTFSTLNHLQNMLQYNLYAVYMTFLIAFTYAPPSWSLQRDKAT